MAKRGRPRGSGQPKQPKKVNVTFLPRCNEIDCVAEPYLIMEAIIAAERADLVQAKIGICWRSGWKQNRWGLLKLGQCKKRSELDRSLDEYDFVILLNAEAWRTFNGEQRTRLLYHELFHAVIEVDANGDEKRDAAGRLITATRPHDIQEFSAVVERYGWDEDLSGLAVAGLADAERPLLQAQKTTGSGGDAQPNEEPPI